MNEFFKEALTHQALLNYVTEVIATALMVMLGNGAVANAELKGTKGSGAGWLMIGFGYGFAVMMPALMFGTVSGNHINPAFTIGLATAGLFDWTFVPGYLLAQFIGAILGQTILVYALSAYFQKTENPNSILGSFSTISALDDGSVESRRQSKINGFINEFVGSFVLFFGALALTKNYHGTEMIRDLAIKQGTTYTEAMNSVNAQAGPIFSGSIEGAHIGLGFLVAALVISLGGATGPALNPARDLGPRLVHHFMPVTVLGKHKGDSKWWYAWVPVVAPILAGIIAAAAFKALYLS